MSEFSIMFVSDICGKAGRQAAAHMIKPMREKHSIDYVIANVENAAGGFGITPEMARKAISYGIDIQTSGNHIWDRHEIRSYIKTDGQLLRPANFPRGVPGRGGCIEKIGDVKVGVINLQGRTYMKDIDCPFVEGGRIVSEMRREADIILIDMHAEATSEKQAMLYWLDGEVTAIIGTHTHVQTADEQISKKGTAYITDTGMTGPYDSVIGMEKEPSLQRFLTGMPYRFTTASDDIRMAGVIIRANPVTGKAISIERFCEKFDLDTFKPEDITGKPKEQPSEEQPVADESDADETSADESTEE
ncbi:MAG: TIGR00282 family metallophosphoesterase [candidate division Zixibacteria bacterium]|nr:TIGR00282 family metallophosphoesterase [candidate division Zixibacteria bacterium]